MGDAENNFQPSKKRAAGVQLSRDNPGLDDDEETSELEAGTFKRASEEVLSTRRIVKVRRQITSTPAAPAQSASNPFAAIRLAPPTSSATPEVEAHSGQSKETEQIDDTTSEKKVDEPPEGECAGEEKKADVNEENVKQSESKVDDLKTQTEDENVGNTDSKSVVEEVAEGGNTGDEVKKAAEADTGETQTTKDVKDEGDDKKQENGEATAEKDAETTPFSSFHQLSSNQNAFSGLSGTGFSATSFSFGSIPKDGSPLGSTFNFGSSNNGNSSIFGSSGENTAIKSESSKFPPMQEVPVETGEENEKAVFTADSVVFEYIDGAWKERGKGELKVNVPTTGTGKARLIMRARGNYRLILNASLFPDMKLTNMDKKGITFACVNSAGEGKVGLSTFALKFKDPSIVEDFRAAVMEHKSTAPAALNTPENSPKADE
ncbi:hypothetical protein ACS0TY_035895 [Phlomoides rotata]